jgi:hypothetical protein
VCVCVCVCGCSGRRGPDMPPLDYAWLTHLINLLKPSGYYVHMLEHCILPTQCVCVLHMVLIINSDCFHKRQEPVGLVAGT